MEVFPPPEPIWPEFYIPGQLEDRERPELIVFPKDITFGEPITSPTGVYWISSNYLPRLDSYIWGQKKDYMRYVNEYADNDADYIDLWYERAKDGYEAAKYVSTKLDFKVSAAGWDMFFTALTRHNPNRCESIRPSFAIIPSDLN